ncbi:MAG: LPS export ABC transporter periplasmic protein LptC [Wenzhouxiangella sp.]|nr:LPS export ABC transporter periplasmic protein LptC [Wenzhouxiangella sp.]
MKRPVVLAACFALLLVLIVRWQFPDDRSSRITANLPDTRFDYTLTDFDARFSDADGRVELLLAGPRLEHDAATRIATLLTPEFHVEPQGANWRGRADRGRLLRDADEMVLEGNVVLEHPTAEGTVRIVTERLHHHVGQRTIEAPGPVEMTRPGHFIRAGRLKIRLDDETVEFFDHVQGDLLPGRTDPDPGRVRSDS